MAKPKWTQGEWHAFMGYLTSPEGKDYPVADVLCHGRTIASVEWPLDDPEELAANCRLLAAAPDLYEACEEALEAIKAESRAHDGKIIPRLVGAAMTIQKALRKSRGEE